MNRTVYCSDANGTYYAHDLTLDATGSGTLTLSILNGSVWTVDGSQYIGYKGIGIVNQTGGNYKGYYETDLGTEKYMETFTTKWKATTHFDGKKNGISQDIVFDVSDN